MIVLSVYVSLTAPRKTAVDAFSDGVNRRKREVEFTLYADVANLINGSFTSSKNELLQSA